MPDLLTPVIGALVVDEHTDRRYVSVLNAQDPKRQDIVEYEIHTGGQTEVRRTTVDNQMSRAPRLALDAARVFVIGNGLRATDGPGQKLVILDRRDLSLTVEVPRKTGGRSIWPSAGRSGSRAFRRWPRSRSSTRAPTKCCGPAFLPRVQPVDQADAGRVHGPFQDRVGG